ncbi:hypothetical protein VXN63_04900 [Marinilactibacillus sp. XAAS-LB27]|uniref:hypothetical protein n=1 Tax=Marinilactibacillus sp. XAAS-LB27 TaxID=3114538 RepID=UPI002E1914EA|nr:hypothetical protein [Marinilactibacillus sp. XAAS-LB27]
MSIKVYRNTGLMGSAMKLKLKINENFIEKIKPQEVLTIQIPREQVTFGLKIFLEKKKDIIVKNGDEIVITPKKYTTYFSWSITIFTFLSIILFSAPVRWIILLLVFFCGVSIPYFYGTYNLTVNGECKT